MNRCCSRCGGWHERSTVVDWQWLPLAAPVERQWRRWLLVRSSVSDPTDLTAYVVFALQDTTLEAVVRVAGTRWTIESGFEAAKGEVGLDDFTVASALTRIWRLGFMFAAYGSAPCCSLDAR